VEGEEGRRREGPRSQEEEAAAVVGVWRKEKKQNCVLFIGNATLIPSTAELFF
jgi:hypothetical protein